MAITSNTFANRSIEQLFTRASLYFPDDEVCTAMTAGANHKQPGALTNEDVLHGGLREANWTRYLLQSVKTNPTEGSRILGLFLTRIQELGKKDASFFVYACDYGTTCHPITVRLLAHLVTEMQQPEFATTISEEAKVQIQRVREQFEGELGVTNRLRQVEQRKADFNEIFPDTDEFAELRKLLLSDDEEVSPKHCAKIIANINDSATRARMTRQYLEALKKCPKSPLAKELLKKYTT